MRILPTASLMYVLAVLAESIETNQNLSFAKTSRRSIGWIIASPTYLTPLCRVSPLWNSGKFKWRIVDALPSIIQPQHGDLVLNFPKELWVMFPLLPAGPCEKN